MQTVAQTAIESWAIEASLVVQTPNIIGTIQQLGDYELAYLRIFHTDQRIRAAMNIAELERNPALESPLFNQTMMAADFIYHEDELRLIDQEIERRMI